MSKLSNLPSEERGAGAVEFALIAPVLFTLVIGISQLGLLFSANAGLKHAVGEAARQATTFPRPSNATLRATMADRRFGLDPRYLSVATITPAKADGRDYIDIRITYSLPMNIPFVRTAPLVLVETRRVFVHPV